MNTTTVASRIFISYSADDKAFADRLKREFAAAGLQIADPGDIPPGEDIAFFFAKAIENAEIAMILVGKSGITSDRTQEIIRAIEHKRLQPKFRIVPVLLPGSSSASLQPFLVPFQAVDLSNQEISSTEFTRIAAVLTSQSDNVSESEGIGDKLLTGGDPRGAMQAYEQALSAALSQSDVAQAKLASLYRKVGMAAEALSMLSEAKFYLETALAIDRKVMEGSQNVANDLNNLGGVLWKMGLISDSRKLYEEALTILEKSGDQVNRANVLNNLGSFALEQGDLVKAEQLSSAVLRINEETFGTTHPSVAIALNNLGGINLRKGDYTAARAYFERALSIDRALYGDSHPSVATRLTNIGGLLQTMGNLEEAEVYFRRALKIDEAVFGPESPDAANGYTNVGGVLGKKGLLLEAKPYLERALSISRKIFGDTHPKVAISLNNLASLYQDLREVNKANDFYRESISILEKAYGPVHIELATTLHNLGGNLFSRGDFDAAAIYLKRALQINEKVYGRNHPETADDLLLLGYLASRRGNNAEALTLINEAESTYQRFFGDKHPRTEAAREALTTIHRRAGRLDS